MKRLKNARTGRANERGDGMNPKKPKARPDDERPIGASVPGGGLTDFRAEEVTQALGPRNTVPRKKPKSIGCPVPKKRGV